MKSVSRAVARQEASGREVGYARLELVSALAAIKDKVRQVTGLKLRRAWVAPVVAGAAGLALALLIRSKRR